MHAMHAAHDPPTKHPVCTAPDQNDALAAISRPTAHATHDGIPAPAARS